MKTKLLIIAFFISLFSCSTIFPQNQTFTSVQNWYRGNIVGGEVKVKLTIISIDKNKARVFIQKEITPFSQVLNVTTDAIKNSDKYYFRCLDNWENEIVGYFYFENGQVILFFDCEKYSDLGSLVGRLYGNTTTLTKVNE